MADRDYKQLKLPPFLMHSPLYHLLMFFNNNSFIIPNHETNILQQNYLISYIKVFA